jgi:hypothetical protein
MLRRRGSCVTLSTGGHVNPSRLDRLLHRSVFSSRRTPGIVLAAAMLASLSSSGLAAAHAVRVDAFLVIATLLIIFPSYVNQVGISLASPLTVRVVLAAGPVLIFFVQLIEGRLSSSPYSLTAATLYAVAAISAGVARQRAIRSAVHA